MSNDYSFLAITDTIWCLQLHPNEKQYYWDLMARLYDRLFLLADSEMTELTDCSQNGDLFVASLSLLGFGMLHSMKLDATPKWNHIYKTYCEKRNTLTTTAGLCSLFIILGNGGLKKLYPNDYREIIENFDGKENQRNAIAFIAQAIANKMYI